MSKPNRKDLAQGSQLWLDFRYNHLGASDCSAIMGLNPWKTPKQLWQQKINHEETKMNAAMEKGRDLESVCLAVFNLEYGFDCKPAVFEHGDIPYMSASLDGWQEDGRVACEIKCPSSEKLWIEAQVGEIPKYYRAQLQHIMEVMTLDSMFYIVFWQGEISVIVVERDQDFIDKMLISELEFWDCIVNLTEPSSSEKDFAEITDPTFDEIQQKYKDFDALEKAGKNGKEALRPQLIEYTDGLSSKGFGCKITKMDPRITIDYKKFCKDKGITDEDLRPYAKYAEGFWKISFEGDKE